MRNCVIGASSIVKIALYSSFCKAFAASPSGIHSGRLFSAGVVALSSLSSSMSMSTSATTSTTTTPPVVKKSLESTSKSYRELLTKLRTLTHLQRAQAVLSWDQMVFMPERAARERAGQVAALAGVIHTASTDPVLKELAVAASADLQGNGNANANAKEEEEEDTEEEDARTLLDLTLKAYEKNARVPSSLQEEKAALSASAYAAWVSAREAKDFAAFEPVLSDCFRVAKEVARATREDESVPLYTQMLDEFEPGMPAERIEAVFRQIREALVPLIVRVMDGSGEGASSPTPPSTNALRGTFPIPAQEAFCRSIVTQLGFDVDHGRIDTSVHPFTTSFSPSDVRITSRFREDEWYQGLAGTIHEGGHAMYEQNLGGSGLEIDQFLSLGTHESQSLFWERHVGLSMEFWRWATPMLKDAFGKNDELGCFNKDTTPEEVYGAVNAVARSLVRVEADELTYPLHVILRYEIERDVVEGKLDVSDIPSRWNKDMSSMLGVEVPNDALGCLQDMHWSALAIGYFPTYLIGSATAAQLAHYCRLDNPQMYEQIERGEFKSIKAWLTDKVHRHGKRYKSLDDLLVSQLGEPLNPQYFIDYLTEKYTKLYKC